jgi:glycosyltransferase involved in cell wall biosynthesis
MEINKPLISVIMNCYNGEIFLEKALMSIFGQTYSNWELIFWDNQSTDKSFEILNKFKDPRIKYFYAPNKTKLYEARNFAIEKSVGEFICFLDVDDWWENIKLETQILLFNKSSIGVVYSNFYFFNTLKNSIKLVNKIGNLPFDNVEVQLLKFNFIGLLTIMIKKEALEGLYQIFDSRFHIIGDYDLMLRLSRKWNFNVCQKPLAYYRWHGENESIKNDYLGINELEILVNEYYTRYNDFNDLYKKNVLMRNLNYLKFIKEKENHNFINALQYFNKLPFCVQKVRMFIILLLPNFIFTKLRFK